MSKVVIFDPLKGKNRPSRLKHQTGLTDLATVREQKTQRQLQEAALDRSLNGFEAYRRVMRAVRLKWFSVKQADELVDFLKKSFSITPEDLEADFPFRQVLIENAARRANTEEGQCATCEDRCEGLLATQTVKEMTRLKLLTKPQAIAIAQWAKVIYKL